ncbi:amine oxidase [Mycena albidolilacea]|uniref:Amine oxidase n=1 Tax=Mycena albidolilacea TaxID=1033008 RepID=A0AAD6ZRL5_9AGAR|nr:amine oxidase [Mycena albidolilacea]
MPHISWRLFLAAAIALTETTKDHKSVLILGGGVAGVIAARSLHQHGIDDFLIIEARDELGGRLRSKEFGADGRQATIELGANWVQGTQEGNGPVNPILILAQKHGLKAAKSDYYNSIMTYDETGLVDYMDIFKDAQDAYTNLTIAAGVRVQKRKVDCTARTGYSLVGAKPKTPQEMAAEYYIDWEYAQTPEQTSWIASSWANNFTYDVDQGGFSDGNLLSIDQRGFKHFIQAEAQTFLSPKQISLNSTVRTIAHSGDGVEVTLANGTRISGRYAISTFSLGVLQNDDVLFEPPLPAWKQEAIHSMTMGTYTKIFLQFEEKFWFDTQFALYADRERGRYPVWQGLDLKNFLPGSGIVFATVTGDYSQRIEAMTDAEVQAELIDVLQTMFPNTTIPTPTAFFFPRWFSDPLYRGSYSNWPSGFVSPHHTNLRANVGNRLWFAGEAMSIKYFGFLHGAYLEGLDIGTIIAKCVREHECKSLPVIKDVSNATPFVV